MADLNAFIQEFNGQSNVGDTDPNRGQCVGLIEVWLDRNGLPHVWGDACNLPANADRGVYDIIPNTPDLVPQPGWIGVLPAGWGGSSVGHTFIVAPGTTQQTLVVFEQNDRIGGGNGACRVYAEIGWPDGLVFIVPKIFEAPAPQPEPQVAPAPDPTPAPQPEVVPVATIPEPTPSAAPAEAPTPVVDPTPTPTPVPADAITVTPIPTPNPLSVDSPTVVPAQTGLSKVKNFLKSITLHEVTIAVALIYAVSGAISQYLNSTQSTTLLGVIVAAVAAVEVTIQKNL